MNSDRNRPGWFVRLYSFLFCAALWVVFVLAIVRVLSAEGEEREPYLFFAVMFGAAAGGASALLFVIERRWRM